MERYTQNHAYLFMRLAVTLVELFLMTTAFDFWFHWMNPIDQTNSFPIEVLIAMGWITTGHVLGLYHHGSIFQLKLLQKPLVWNIVMSLLFLLAFISVYDSQGYSTEQLLMIFTSGALTITTVRILLGLAYKYRRWFFNFSDYKVMIIGAGKPALALESFFDNHKFGKVYRFLDDDDAHGNEEEAIRIAREKVSEIKHFCLREQVNEIYYTLPLNKGQDVIEEMAQFADNNYIHFKLANDFGILSHYEGTVAFFDQTPVITLRKDPLASMLNRAMKRGFDILFSLLVIILVMPIVFLIIGTAILIDSPGPILFLQKRSGRKNRIFTCFKFRTMYVQDESAETPYKQASKNDPRITRVGAFLRKTNLDEFPQFFNVLLGHMSVVGPRPHPPKLNERYIPLIKNYPFRYFITPGITGHAQVNGYRGETQDSEEMAKRVEYDAWYIQNWTFGLDIKIVFQTFFRMLKKDENAY